MRRISAIGAFAVLLLSIGALSASDPPPAATEQNETPSVFDRVFGGSNQKPAAKKSEAPKRAPTREEVVRSLKQEQEILEKRQLFCIKLRSIATETHDDVLLRKAEALDKLAWEVYSKKVGSLESVMEQVKVAEAALEERRNWAPTSTASNAAPARAPNGRPLNNN